MYKQDSKILNLRRGLSAADQKLVDRLEKLKEDGKGPPPSESEIRQRLAHLKGETQFADGPSKPVSCISFFYKIVLSRHWIIICKPIFLGLYSRYKNRSREN